MGRHVMSRRGRSNLPGCVISMYVSDGTSEADVGARYAEPADQGADSGPTLVIDQLPDAVANSEGTDDEYGDS